jgi:hypothetical protein
MSTHFSMGAINKTTNKYEYPKIANKINKYKCPFCEKDVIFRNGKIKQPHFAHCKSNTPCSYYEKPNETQIHKDAKLLMKTLLDNKTTLNFYRTCNYCNEENDSVKSFFARCNKEVKLFTHKINDYDDSQAYIEYKFTYNESRKSADVALTQKNELKYIFEICYKNKTKEENRPEPWFEIKAETLINETNSGENIKEDGEITIECIRDYKCDICKKKEEYEKERQNVILENLKKREQEKRIREYEQYKEKRLREYEQEQEKYELLSMGKEDQRTIEKILLMKMIEEEIQKQIEEEREFERKKREEEREKRLEEERENKRKIIEEEFELELIKQKNYENKSRAVDILYNWFNNSKSIYPFYVDEESTLLCVKKNIKLSYTHKTVDLILYEEDSQSEEGRYEKYNLFLVNNVSERVFKDRYYNSEFGIRVYFISIEWVLSQTEIPNKIEYIASIDNFDIGKNRYLDCVRCKYDTEFWVKRLFTKTDYKIINISICCGRRESEYVECERCGSLDTPLSEMEKNGEMLCKSCII